MLKKIIATLTIIFLFLSASTIGIIFVNKKINDLPLVDPQAQTDKAYSKSLSNKSNTKISPELETVVQKALEETEGSYGIVIKNLRTGETFSKNEHKTFEPGSLYKLWIMAVTYKQIWEGKLQEGQILSQNIPTLNKKFSISPEFAELTDGGITLSVASALNQMITISHNYASLLLTEKVGLSSVALFLKENGFNESSVGINGESPTTTPYDIAMFLEKLYQNKLANQQHTNAMIDLLKKQQLNKKLPKYLPQNVTVAHKTGEIGMLTHDAGIVYSKKGDYIIVVFSESDSPPGAEERIAEISRDVYSYFAK